MTIRKDKSGLDATRRPTDVEIAWAAGIYEGEGSCVKSGTGGRSFGVTVCQKDPELLYRLRETFGGSIRLYGAGKQGRFTIYSWQLCGDRGRVFLAAIYPFLTKRRQAQIVATSAAEFVVRSQAVPLQGDVLSSARVELLLEMIQRRIDVGRKAAVVRKKARHAGYYAEKKSDPLFMEKRRSQTREWRKRNKEQREGALSAVGLRS